MLEHIAQMGPMLILAALLAGWTAEAVWYVHSYGLVPDMVLGLIGSVLLGGFFWGVVSGNTGMLAMFVIGCTGAALALVAQRSLRPSTGVGT